jgi:tetratricopeptide (TPR) repeat protein
VLDLLAGLVDKSLVIADTQKTVARYRLLETVRQYAQERLRASGEDEVALGRHRDYFLKVAEEAEPQLTGAEQREWFELLESEHDNLRQAIRFCLEAAEGANTGLRLGSALWRFWEVRGHWSEGREHLTGVLGRAVEPEQRWLRAQVLNSAGILAKNQGYYEMARALYEEGLVIFRELEDKRGIANCLNSLGVVTKDQGDFAEARALYEQSLAIRRELGDKRGIAASLNNLGVVAKDQGDYAAARALYEEALEINRALGNRAWEANNLGNLGVVAKDQGDFAEARALYEECLVIFRELGDKRGISHSLMDLGEVTLNQGDYAVARTLLGESLEIRRELGNKGGVADTFDAFAALAHRQQKDRRAARHWGAATALREQISAPRPPVDQAKYEQQTRQVRTILGETAFTAAFEEGYAMPLEQAIEDALETD